MSQTYFDQIADQWDDLRASMFNDEVREIAISRAGLRPESIAIDLGAGTGFISRGLAPKIAKVHAVDNSAEMLAVARENLAEFENVEFHLADGALITLQDGSADAVLANMYLHHAPDPEAAIREMARLLKPGGRVVITDLDRHDHAFLREEHHDLWMGFDRSEVQKWLMNAGLVNALVEDTQQSCGSQSQAGNETATVSIFVAVGSKAVPGMEQAVGAHYREIAGGRGGCCSDSFEPTGMLTSDTAIPLDVIQPGSSACCGPAEAQATHTTVADFSLGCGNPVALADLRPGQVVLDIGSGAGADAFPAAQRVGPEGRIIGLDRLPEMVDRARATALAHGYQNVEFRLGDALNMPIEDQSVDVVMSNCVINLLQDKGEAFRQAHRVLRAGGSLSISDIVTDRAFSPALRADPDSWAACVTGALPESEYLGLIAAAGFTGITTTRSQPWTAEDGTQVYSLSVKAIKPSS